MNNSNRDKKSMFVIILAGVAALAGSFVFVLLPRFDMTKLTRVTLEGTTMSVMLPGTPVRDVKKMRTELGELESVEYTIGSSLLLYSVIYTDFPQGHDFAGNPDGIAGTFKRALDPLLARTNGRIVSEKDVQYRDYRGKDVLLVTKSNINIRTRFYLVGNRFVQLYVMTTADRITNPKTEEFIGSFSTE